MKLLLITNIPTPYRNAFYSVLGNYLEQNGDKLRVIFCAKNEPNRHWKIGAEQMQFDHLFLPGIHFTLKKIFVHFNAGILRYTKEFDPDVILYSGAWNMLTVIFSLTHTRIFKKRWKTLFWNEGHEGSILHPKGLIPKIRLRILNLFDGFAVPNQRSKSYLFDYLKLKAKPVIMLPNTVNGRFYSKPQSWNEEDTIRVKKQLGLLPENRICIQVSQIESRKGVKELITYWNTIPSEIKEKFVLLLVGEGSMRAELQSYCTVNEIHDIILTGNRTADQVRELLFVSDFFILLTKNDPNPLTLIESGFAGLPILTTVFAGNYKEVIPGNLNGIVLDSINYADFLEAFKKLKVLSANPEVRKFAAENAYANFDIDMVVERFISQVKTFLLTSNDLDN